MSKPHAAPTQTPPARPAEDPRLAAFPGLLAAAEAALHRLRLAGAFYRLVGTEMVGLEKDITALEAAIRKAKGDGP